MVRNKGLVPKIAFEFLSYAIPYIFIYISIFHEKKPIFFFRETDVLFL